MKGKKGTGKGSKKPSRIFSLGSVSKTPYKKKLSNLKSYSKRNYTKDYTKKLERRVTALKKQYKQDSKKIFEAVKVWQSKKENSITGSRGKYRDQRTGKKLSKRETQTKVFKSVQAKVTEWYSIKKRVSLKQASKVVTKRIREGKFKKLIIQMSG